jgi:uncharacterized membrane protein (DUF2068 family)
MFAGAAFFSLVGSLGVLSLFIGTIFGFGAVVLFIMGVLLLLTAYGFWKGTRWGWWLGIVISALCILSIAFVDIVGLIVGLIAAYYLTRPRIRKYFGF